MIAKERKFRTLSRGGRGLWWLYRESFRVDAPLDQRDAYRQFATVEVAVLYGCVHFPHVVSPGTVSEGAREEDTDEDFGNFLQDVDCRVGRGLFVFFLWGRHSVADVVSSCMSVFFA